MLDGFGFSPEDRLQRQCNGQNMTD